MKIRAMLAIILLCLIAPCQSGLADDLPESAYISGVVGYAQTYVLSCEARSAADWAAFFGVSVSESDFQDNLPTSNNPDVGFVGYLNDPWGNLPPDSYGVHADPVANLLQVYSLPADARRSLGWADLQAEIAAGRPVIVWVIGQMWSGNPVEYSASDGQTVTVARFEHTMILIGYTPEVVHVVDAYSGQTQTYALGSFLASWGVLGNMAVVYEGNCCSQPAPPAGPGSSYTVQPGDYLTALAVSFSTTWQELVRLNDIPYPYTIYPGQVLVLPGSEPQEATPTIPPEVLPETPVESPPPQPSPITAPFVLRLPLVYRAPHINPPAVAAPVLEGLPETYIVQSGDNLLALGPRFGLDWRVMAALNNLNYPFVIFSGQILDLP
jgi:LysM repeat protein/uncharacterized protein YvpB